jgi:phosphatidylethanolamine/phosphatidyl-N-methylethanolamine N-methyltransferase
MSDSSRDRHTSQDLGQFLKSWFKDPKLIGAVAPSGRALAKLMSSGLKPGARVIELGAGTGTVTEALLKTGVRPEDLYLLERNEAFFDILSRRFPGCPLVAADALDLRERFAGELGSFDFVVSGLPLLLFSPEQKAELFEQIFAVLGPNGAYQQFTYGARCPIDRDNRARLGLKRKLLGWAALNIPPAFVYRFTRA